MTTTLNALYNNRTGREALRQKAGAAFLERAYAIMAEPADTENHANRVVWARRMIQTDLADLAYGYLGWVLKDTTVQTNGASATDDEIRAAATAALPHVIPAAIPPRPDLTDAPADILAYILALEAALGI